MSKGFVTVPTDSTLFNETKEIIDYLGADAVRDCDGVSLPKNVNDLGCEVYKAYFIVREDHEYAKKHPELLQSIALITKRYTAFDKCLDINLLENICKDTIVLNLDRYKEFYQVYDRTTGKLHTDWTLLDNNVLRINNPIKYHEYTVSFFGKNIWDPVQVYNYASNNWQCEKDIDLDPIFAEALQHMLSRMEEWCKSNPNITVVRFTTFFYNFMIVYDNPKHQTYWDWHSYAMSASPSMFDLFYKTYGYKVTLEDIVTGGYYASKFMIPSKATKDYMDLVQRKCCEWAKLFVDICHKYNKKAMMFDGDHRIGVEPYNPYFDSIGLDAVVGAPHSGPYIRLLSDMTGVKYKEGRLNPYFFPNECPSDELGVEYLTKNWNSERRALLRKPIDRIGFGGYLKLALSYPNFLKKMKEVCDEFRLIKEYAKGGSYTHFKIAILSYWGKMFSWMINGTFTDDSFQQGDGYTSVIDALAGQPLDVDFISFDEVINSNILNNYKSIILVGINGSSFQGDSYWKNPLLLTKIREFVFNGGGLLGIGEASGYQYNGHFIQLDDVFGIEKECGFTYSQRRSTKNDVTTHWIIENIDFSNIEFVLSARDIYSTSSTPLKTIFNKRYDKDTLNSGNLVLSVNTYGKGRSVFISGLVSSFSAFRLIYKSILWSAHKEDNLLKAFSTNYLSDCYYYPGLDSYAIINNSDKNIDTEFYDFHGNKINLSLNKNEIKWIKG